MTIIERASWPQIFILDGLQDVRGSSMIVTLMIGWPTTETINGWNINLWLYAWARGHVLIDCALERILLHSSVIQRWLIMLRVVLVHVF